MNSIKIYDLKYNWNILFWIVLKYILGFHKKIIIQIFRTLTSSLSLVNKSLIISMFSFSIAKYNAVLLYYDEILWNIMILNVVEIYNFEYHWNIKF